MAKKVINRVYPNAEEKLVKNTIIHHVRGNLYFDEAGEYAVEANEVKNLFSKGLIVCSEGAYYIPTKLVDLPERLQAEVHIIKTGEDNALISVGCTAHYTTE